VENARQAGLRHEVIERGGTRARSVARVRIMSRTPRVERPARRAVKVKGSRQAGNSMAVVGWLAEEQVEEGRWWRYSRRKVVYGQRWCR